MPVEVVCGLSQAVKEAVEAVRGLVEAERTNSGFEIVVEAVKGLKEALKMYL